jgi:hypothetical protein
MAGRRPKHLSLRSSCEPVEFVGRRRAPRPPAHEPENPYTIGQPHYHPVSEHGVGVTPWGIRLWLFTTYPGIPRSVEDQCVRADSYACASDGFKVPATRSSKPPLTVSHS